jgi:DNA-binding transcriptional LysR family regulator
MGQFVFLVQYLFGVNSFLKGMDKRMDLRQLSGFVTVAEELGFTRAANRLYLAQPALTKQIQRLEDEFGFHLFVRDKRSVRLTNAGVVLLERARQALQSSALVTSTAEQVRRGEAGHLRIAFTPAAPHRILPVLIRTFRTRYPHIRCTFVELTSGEQVAALKGKTLDLGILRPAGPPLEMEDNIAFRELSSESFVALLPRAHRLSTLSSVPLKRLAGEEFVMVAKRIAPLMYEQIHSACHAAGFTPNIAHEATQMHAVAALVAAGCGVSLLPGSVRHVQLRDLVYRRLRATTLRSTIGLAWSAEMVTAPVQAFLRVAAEITFPAD